MKRKVLKHFEKSIEHIHHSTVLLDIDGTLLPDGHVVVDPEVGEAVEYLKKDNVVFLLTNGSDKERVEGLAESLGVPVAPVGVPAGKPRLSAVVGIPTDRPLVVVGDKLVTDGILARRLGVSFVWVSTKHREKRTLFSYLSHFIDDVVSLFI